MNTALSWWLLLTHLLGGGKLINTLWKLHNADTKLASVLKAGIIFPTPWIASCTQLRKSEGWDPCLIAPVSFAKQSRAHPLSSTPTPREHQKCEGQLLTIPAPQKPWVSTDFNLPLIPEGSYQPLESNAVPFSLERTRRRLIGHGSIFDGSIFAVVTKHIFIRNISKWLFPPAHILRPLGYAFQNTSKSTQLPQWHNIVPEQSYHAAAVKVHLGRTLLPQLQAGLSDPPQQSATAMVKSIQCSHRSLVCNQPGMNRR